ncbi:MAG: hypothetical protein COB15_14355 [Flavobacteriales bacterium]|nr:MAG: hypothetical protein COB15_14355 [Flavobacteriales bacterium]
MFMKQQLFLLLMLISIGVFAQAPPQKLNYQAVARDLAGNPLISTPVNITFDILQGSASGTAVYTETHNGIINTNAFGLFTAEIGGGAPALGTFAGINWSANIYYLQVTVNGDVMPATQLLSVPYALHAGTATSGVQGIPGANGISIDWQGTQATPPTTPSLNQAYYNSSDGISYIWDGTAWQIISQDGAGSSFVAGAGITILGNTISATDTSVTNEIQVITINGTNDTIFLSNGGGSVPLPSVSGDNWGTDTVAHTGANISGQGTTGSPLMITDNDGDPTNELELPMTGNTVGDVLKWNGSAWVSGNDSVDDADANAFNEIQNLSWNPTNGNVIDIVGGIGISLASNTPSANQILTWNGANWIAQNSGSGADNWGTQVVVSDSSLSGDGTSGNPLSGFDGQYSSLLGVPIIPTYTAGTGIAISGSNVISNTAAVNTDSQDLTSTIAGSNATINISGGASTSFSVNDADADATNELITSFGLNGTNDSLVIKEAGIDHTFALSNLNDGDWTKGSGSILYNNTDNIGIGTTTPTYALEIKRSQAGSGALLGITNPTTGDATIHFSTGTGNFSMGRSGNTFQIAHASNLGSNVRMTIGSTGNVGFGLTAPTARIHAEGFGGQALKAQNSSSTTATMNLINNSGGPALTITNGYTGLNVATPTAWFHLNNTLRLQNLGGAAPSAGSVLTSIDANGNAQWITLPSNTSFWSGSSGVVYPATISDNVGIGTNSPTVKLDVLGGVNILNTSGDPLVIRSSTDGFGLKVKESDNGNDAVTILGYASRGRILINENGTTTINFDANSSLASYINAGNFGIGTSTPTRKLEVNDNSTNSAVLIQQTGSGQALHVYSATSSSLQNVFEVSSFGAGIGFNVMGDGKVGVGTSSPSQELHVVGNTTSDDYLYNTPKVHYLNVSNKAFNLAQRNSGLHMSELGNYYRYIQNGTVGTQGYMYAPVNLPDGATITNVEANIYDTDAPYDATIRLIYFNPSGPSASVVTGGSLTSSGSSGYQTLTSVALHTVNNSTYAYHIEFLTRQAAGTLGVVNFKITYTVTKAD